MARSLKFIDLFAGLGGFHVALERLGHECVFASELDQSLRDVYAENFGIRPSGDIRGVKSREIPRHDILCAGFPCQPFSKAGTQQGLDCPRHGDLFDQVIRILRYHQPKYFVLENVPNLLRHNGGETYRRMKSRLKGLGYDVREHHFSPVDFGIPQSRQRAYIVGSTSPLTQFHWPRRQERTSTSISWVLDKAPDDARALSPQAIEVIETWQRFLDRFPADEEIPWGPIWAMEFGANYPFEEETPYALGTRRLAKYRGARGQRLDRLSPKERMQALPSYARTAEEEFPAWKKGFIRTNRELYRRHKKWIDRWLPAISNFSSSHQKFEWNCRGEVRDIWRNLIQFRASGVRVKRANAAPSLVAMTTTQVPVVGWQKRYLTPRECARLQSLGSLATLPAAAGPSFKALGNAVNADVAERIVSSLLEAHVRRVRKV